MLLHQESITTSGRGSGKKSYTIEVDYVNLTWKPTEIKQINVYGTFNGWSTAKDLMIYNEETGIWSAECDITTIGDGFYFLMNTNPDQINWDWRLYYTSESGLYLSDQNGDNINPPRRVNISLRWISTRWSLQ